MLIARFKYEHDPQSRHILQRSSCSTANRSSATKDPSGANDVNSASSQNSNSESFVATSDCSSLSSPYIPSLTSMALTSSNVSFEIKCGTDCWDPDADFMTVAVFTFKDCIAACARFNEVCVSGIKTLPITTLIESRGGFRRQIPSSTLASRVKTVATFLKKEY